MAGKNPLLDAKPNQTRIVAPTDPDERRKFWIERGNRILWGIEPTSKGDYLPAQHHLEWRCKDGHYFIAEIGR